MPTIFRTVKIGPKPEARQSQIFPCELMSDWDNYKAHSLT